LIADVTHTDTDKTKVPDFHKICKQMEVDQQMQSVPEGLITSGSVNSEFTMQGILSVSF